MAARLGSMQSLKVVLLVWGGSVCVRVGMGLRVCLDWGYEVLGSICRVEFGW